MTIADTKDASGLWLMEVRRERTVSGSMWKNLQIRTKEGGAEQTRRHHYQGCRNLFDGFQQFTEWHTNQIGYGLGYQLDKDLLFRGNKDYSPSTCILLPRAVNTLLTNRKNHRGPYPVGVTFDKRSKMYNATCSNGSGKPEYLGRFSDPERAFAAYKKCKESLMHTLAERYKDTIDYRAYAALVNYEIFITD